MANFYYVKNGGLTDGSDDGRVATTRSTGSFATKGTGAYYDSIIEALTATTSPTAGDFIMCSDAHDKTHTTTQTYIIPDKVTIISVADLALDQYAIGASEVVDNSGTTLDVNWDTQFASSKEAYMLGMTIGAEDDINFGQVSGRWYLQDCTLKLLGATSTGDILSFDDGVIIDFKDCLFDFTHVDNEFLTRGGGLMNFDGGAGTGTKTTQLCQVIGQGGGAFTFRNMDLSSILASSGSIIEINSVGDDRVDVYVENCKLPTSYALTVGTPLAINHKIVLSGCGTTDEYHHFEREEIFNVVTQDLTTFLNATYDGSTGFSTKITTSDRVFSHNPYKYLLGVIPAQDLSTAMTVTVECTSDASLTDNDIWLEISRQDATDQALGVVVSTRASADVLAAGTNLTTSGTGSWTSGDTEDYIITKDLGAIAAATNSNVEVWACMGKASISANFDQPTIATT